VRRTSAPSCRRWPSCAGTSSDRKSPDEGRVVAVLGPGSPADTEHAYRAGTTLAETTSESEAIATVKVAGRGAVIAGEGVFFAYRLIGPAGLKPAIVADRGLRVEDGVTVVIVGAAVYRPGHHATETTPETGRAYGDPFAPYRDLHRERGGLRNLGKAELFGVFEAAMRDNALAILGESQRQAEAKRAQFSRGPAGTRPAEQDVIDRTATQALAVQRQIDAIDDKRKRLTSSRRVSGNRSTEDVSYKMLTALEEQRRPLAQQRRQIDLQYPMIGRYKSAESLQRFLARSKPERIQALASDAATILDNIRETRSHLLAGRIGLWAVPGVVDSTIAGLGFAKGSPQRAWIEEEAAARARRDRIADLVLAAFSIGLGLAAAFTTGGLSLVLTAGAVGLGAYDAIQLTEDYDVKSAATDTDIDPSHSLLPEDMRVHWGWLVLAWAGLGLDAFDVAKAIANAGKTGKTVDVVEQAARALAKQDQALLARLRKAAGSIDLGEVVSDANRQELSRLVGAPITIEPAPVASVRIRYDVDGKGRTFVTGIDVGSQAKAGDILAHADTVRLLQRRSRLVERLDDLWTRIRTFGKRGANAGDNPFPPRSAGFDSWHELHKLKDLIRIRRAQLDDLLARGADAPALQAELRKQLAFLENDLDIHARVVDSLAAQRGGRGFIAMSDDTRAALEQGKRLPEFPDKGADD
jgi:hypothetical protein